jgi:hypothetical protein
MSTTPNTPQTPPPKPPNNNTTTHKTKKQNQIKTLPNMELAIIAKLSSILIMGVIISNA